MKRVVLGVGAAMLAGVAGCQSGPPGPPGGMPPGGPEGGHGGMLQEAKITRPIAILFTEFDVNNDLLLTREELDVAIPTEFQRADADQSGTLTGFEIVDWCLLKMGDKEAQPDLRAMDTDMSYTVTPAEFAIALIREFDHMDANQDGRVTRAEMLMDAPRQQFGGPGGGGGGQQQRPSGGRGGRGSGGGPGGGGPGGGGGPF